MRAQHDRGLNGLRPVHPACEAHGGLQCTCEVLWHYWDGEPDTLDREIEVATRLDNQTRVAMHAASTGKAYVEDIDQRSPRRTRVVPDGDLLQDMSFDDYVLDSDVETLSRDDLETHGFWRESEFLKQFRQGD